MGRLSLDILAVAMEIIRNGCEAERTKMCMAADHRQISGEKTQRPNDHADPWRLCASPSNRSSLWYLVVQRKPANGTAASCQGRSCSQG